MSQNTRTSVDIGPRPDTDLQNVLQSEIKEWEFNVYFHQKNANQTYLALELRDAVLRLRRDGAFVAVPYFRTNTDPYGPHPIGSYSIWVPSETFSSVFSFMCQNHGELSVLIRPLSRDQRRDYSSRACWLGSPLPLDLSALPDRQSDNPPLFYPSLQLGYSAVAPALSLDDRNRLGQNVENHLKYEREAARAPLD